MTPEEEDAELLADVTAWLLGVGLCWIDETEIGPMWQAYSDLLCAQWLGHEGHSDDFARGLMAGWAAHQSYIQNQREAV